MCDRGIPKGPDGSPGWAYSGQLAKAVFKKWDPDMGRCGNFDVDIGQARPRAFVVLASRHARRVTRGPSSCPCALRC